MPFYNPARARFSLRKTHDYYTCLFLPLPSLKSISSPPAQTSRTDPPTKTPLKIPSQLQVASHNPQEARQSKTSRTTTSNALTRNALTSNAQDPNTRNENARNEDRNAQETPKNNGQHALNSRSPLVKDQSLNADSFQNWNWQFPPYLTKAGLRIQRSEILKL
jgi:hypothetical protein